MGHWICANIKKRETNQNRGGKGATNQNREINDKTVRNCSTSSTKKCTRRENLLVGPSLET
jgi:hypothetical protein